MKNRASGLVKQIIATLKTMAKSKTLALKTKTNAIKARLIIFSLLRNKKFMMSSISHKIHSVLGHHSHPKEECFLEADRSEQIPNKAIAVSNNHNVESYVAIPNLSETHLVEENKGEQEEEYQSYYRYEYDGGEEEEDDDDDDDDDDNKYPDLTHSLFDSEDLDFGGSVIDLVKSSKEEAGEEFKLEDEIDHVADLFIKRVRRQMILQKQQSIKRHKEEMMLKKGA